METRLMNKFINVANLILESVRTSLQFPVTQERNPSCLTDTRESKYKI